MRNLTHEQELIRETFINDIKALQDKGFYLFSFILIGQAIETLGVFLDKKPLKAKHQSKKRFALAINKLFDSRYRKLNENDWFYKQFRCNMAHLFTPGSTLFLTNKNEKGEMQHLGRHQDKLVLVAEELYEDFKNACEKSLELKVGKFKV